MKKLYTLLFTAVAAFGVNAQNVVTNGGFETWSGDPIAPDGWTIFLATGGATGGVTQENTIVHSGSSSVKITVPAATGNHKVQYTDIPVVAGTSYTIDYWYNDEGDAAKGRHWGSFRTATGVTATQDSNFQPDYLPNTTGWQHITVSAVAPPDAVVLRVDFRGYKDVTGSGNLYYDDVMVGVTGTLAVKQNAIEGLRVYPNPVKNGNLFITSDSNDTKAVAIYNVLGKQVLTATVNDAPVNVAHLSAGVYIVKITEAGKTATKKLVIE